MSLAACLLPGIASAKERELYVAALRERDGGYAAAIFSADEGVLARVALPARGHSFAIRPGTRECIAFARRPGNFAVAFDEAGTKPPVWFTAHEGRHFYGHGVFSRDGKLLYSTENDHEGARGVIGVRDATDGYRQIGGFSSGGVGPHDMALLGDGHTLVVANGGIETHPDFGREPLNLDTMKPNLSYIDSRHGEVRETYALPRALHQLSIRHLSMGAGGTVVFGCQHKGPRNERPMLLGLHKRGSKLELLHLPAEANASLRNYVGSICCDSSGEIAAATSPPGGTAVYLDIAGKRFLGQTSLADASGVTGRRRERGFLLTSGSGKTAFGNPGHLEIIQDRSLNWDNHVAQI